tara:strand:- start:173 stop:1132 length:960 start_codon:yes stop_codon:yes gene_type:complete
MAVILQPCGNKDARAHYNDTVMFPVPHDSVSSFLNETDNDNLKDIYPDGMLKIWGVTPNNQGKWKKVEAGDITLFSKSGSIFASAVATYKIRNKPLAEKLWGLDAKGNAWEYIYFIAELQAQKIPYIELNRVIPYKDNFVIQGFMVLDEIKSQNVVDIFNLESQTYYPEVSSKAVAQFKTSDDLDPTASVTIRKEQAALRRTLFNNRPNGTCCICLEQLPVSFLWASHLKKRSLCSTEEKLDFHNVAAPMCKFGCDELYEKGYIGVQNGKIVKVKHYCKTSFINNYISKVIGKECNAWSRDSKQYFDWHYTWHQDKVVT